MTIAEDFYDSLPSVDTTEDLLTFMIEVKETSINHDITGSVAFFLFKDKSWLRTEFIDNGDAINSWHGVLKDKMKMH